MHNKVFSKHRLINVAILIIVISISLVGCGVKLRGDGPNLIVGVRAGLK